MSFPTFLGFQKAELRCPKTELICQKADLGCHNTNVDVLSILTPEGAPIFSEINNFSHASSTRCKRFYG